MNQIWEQTTATFLMLNCSNWWFAITYTKPHISINYRHYRLLSRTKNNWHKQSSVFILIRQKQTNKHTVGNRWKWFQVISLLLIFLWQFCKRNQIYTQIHSLVDKMLRINKTLAKKKISKIKTIMNKNKSVSFMN